MGYYFFNITPVKESYNKRLNSFLFSIGSAIRDGKSIGFADNDINYTLAQQHRRIGEKGLNVDYEVYTTEQELSNFKVGSNWNDDHYENAIAFRFCGVKRNVNKNGKILYKDNKKSVIYETVSDVLTGTHPDNVTFSCPNCGGVATVAELQNGCPYCSTMYKMDDLFPKVTGYYFMDEPGIDKEYFKKGVLISMISFAAFIIIGNIILNHDQLGSVGMIIALLFGAVFGGAVGGYFLFSIFLLFRMIARIISTAGKMGTAGSRRRFEVRMKNISPDFSYEYFTSKAVSLIKNVIFAKNESELPFYKGEALDPKMKDIIDLNYGGALGLEGFREDNGIVTVETDAFFDVLYATGEKVFLKHKIFSAVFQRRTDIPVNFNFSMTRICCPTCGSSFDATRNKNCPSCGNVYEIISDDWALVSLKEK